MKNWVYYIDGFYLLFIINKGFPLSLLNKTPTTISIYRNDCRKEPQELQKEGTEEEGVSIMPPKSD